jgi:hypothetical protein
MPRHWPDSLADRAVIEVVTDAPSAASVVKAISACERRFGARGCAGRMAQEVGDHPRGQLSGRAGVGVLARAITALGPQRLTRGSNHRHLSAKESFDALRITRS